MVESMMVESMMVESMMVESMMVESTCTFDKTCRRSGTTEQADLIDHLSLRRRGLPERLKPLKVSLTPRTRPPALKTVFCKLRLVKVDALQGLALHATSGQSSHRPSISGLKGTGQIPCGNPEPIARFDDEEHTDFCSSASSSTGRRAFMARMPPDLPPP
ncbi:predicted protein [Chaetomium globosum CBS 148.51]|uniref:Uncharacterized protein n=1 Tax=Chaetomium globosum (strain ATCC 6205 / CBS 148.51 / DSM 1962 / NBRC 6347 / NRRL 1970) TaxID=306901 RepID=Q2GQ95_CHAGB|nr:uncharacterized protein CHGG_09859 [Chaetomium globosum CBS 148.51]EAQ83455.1 predicted protein [Chaetomium globosum CBS 148.51]